MHQGFLSAIRDDPDSDEPRLIYADWLEDNGDPDRAEFIRVQCRLARMEGDEAEFFDLQERQWSLLAKNQDDWLRADFPVRVCQRAKVFHRGFLRWAECTAHEFTTLKAFNRLTGAGLKVEQDPIDGLGECPRLAEVAELDLSRMAHRDDALVGLLKSPYLGRLVRLLLPGWAVTSNSLEALAGCEQLARLTDLSISRLTLPSLGDQLLAPLASSPVFTNLTHLALSVGYAPTVAQRGIDDLARSPHLHLRSLDLTTSQIGPDGMRAIADSLVFEQLEKLDITGCNITDEGVHHLAGSRHLRNLTHLQMKGNQMRAAGSNLARASLPNLHTLTLASNPLREDEVGELLASDALPTLRVLNLSLAGLTDGALARMADRAALGRLTALNFSSNLSPTNQGLAAFFKSANLANLRSLNLTDCHAGTETFAALGHAALERLHVLTLDQVALNDAEAEALAAAQALRNVRKLSLYLCRLDDDNAEKLIRSPVFANLRELHLGANHLTARTARLLRDHLPALHTLTISSNELGDEGVLALVTHPAAARLRVLDVSRNRLGLKGLTALVDSPYLTGLAQLSPGTNRDTPQAVKALKQRFGTRVRV